jgi:hypothetical protein
LSFSLSSFCFHLLYLIILLSLKKTLASRKIGVHENRCDWQNRGIVRNWGLWKLAPPLTLVEGYVFQLS